MPNAYPHGLIVTTRRSFGKLQEKLVFKLIAFTFNKFFTLPNYRLSVIEAQNTKLLRTLLVRSKRLSNFVIGSPWAKSTVALSEESILSMHVRRSNSRTITFVTGRVQLSDETFLPLLFRFPSQRPPVSSGALLVRVASLCVGKWEILLHRSRALRSS